MRGICALSAQRASETCGEFKFQRDRGWRRPERIATFTRAVPATHGVWPWCAHSQNIGEIELTRIITSPTQARHTLSYVLNNWRKHEEDRAPHANSWNVDPFSTGVLFWGWKEHAHEPLLWKWRDTYDPLVVYRPRTWLLREGWMRGGGAISFHEVPRSRK